MSARFAIEPLANAHDRSRFKCGNARIDDYFRKHASQDVKRNYAACFVVREIETDRLAGFYTLSSSTISLNEIPETVARKLPLYPTVPAVLFGWLARDLDFRGDHIGALLLFDAIRTVATIPIGVYAIFADAIDDPAAAFYASFGFVPLVDKPRRLFLPVATALRLVI